MQWLDKTDEPAVVSERIRRLRALGVVEDRLRALAADNAVSCDVKCRALSVLELFVNEAKGSIGAGRGGNTSVTAAAGAGV